MRAPSSSSTDSAVLDGLRRGDEGVFAELVDHHSGGMLRVAMAHVPTRAVAEEVVQEAWLGVLEGAVRFEGRSSLKTWIYRILVKRAITRGQRERRSVPFSALAATETGGHDPAVDPDWFQGPEDPFPRHWSSPPAPWDVIPEARLLSKETLGLVERTLASLPPAQRTVVTLRDVQDWTSEEVRNALEISETNQRVLLHRGRSKLRRALEAYLADEPADPRRGERERTT